MRALKDVYVTPSNGLKIRVSAVRLRPWPCCCAAKRWNKQLVRGIVAERHHVPLNMRTASMETEVKSQWYLEVPPSPDLLPWISHFRVICGPAPSSGVPTTLRLLTDGCAGVVIDCGPSALATPPVFMGVMQAATVVTLGESRELIGVRFKPGGALPFVTSSLHELTGLRVPLPLLWGDLAHELGNAVRSATFSERIPALEHCLRGRMRQQQSAASRRQASPSPREVALVAQAIVHLGQEAAVRVSDVAAALGVGDRRLERVFNRAVGVPPKVFHRMRRCCEAARLIRHACGEPPHATVNTTLKQNIARCNWPAIGSAAGYADQAHFIREFRALTGVTPVAYATEHHPVGFMQYDGSCPG
ncbi:MAG: AraC family transcriptional regulator [Gemmatimonadaceae bacterium]